MFLVFFSPLRIYSAKFATGELTTRHTSLRAAPRTTVPDPRPTSQPYLLRMPSAALSELGAFFVISTTEK